MNETPVKVSKRQALEDAKQLAEALLSDPPQAVALVRERPWVASMPMPKVNPISGLRGEFPGAVPMVLAAALRDVALMEALLQSGASANAVNPNNGKSALMHALDDVPAQAEFDAAPAVRLLLAKGARLDSVDRYGRGVLYQCESLDLPATLFKELIERGARIDCRDRHGRHHVCNSIGDVKGNAARRANLIELLDAGVDVAPRGVPLDHTPLQAALHVQDFDMAQALMARGASLHAMNHLGQTLIHEPLEPAVLRWVLRQDPSLLEQQDYTGATPVLSQLRLVHNTELDKESRHAAMACVVELMGAGAAPDLAGDQIEARCGPRALLLSIKDPALQETARALLARHAAHDALQLDLLSLQP